MKWIVMASAFLTASGSISLAQAAPRVDAIARRFVGAPYRFSPLGEGPSGKFDRDPRIRFDAFDCTTFVETVMALSSLPSDDPSQSAKQVATPAAIERMDRIRYRTGSSPAFENRNHVPELDWIPHVTSLGLAQDVTTQLSRAAGIQSRVAVTRLDRRQWFARLPARALQGPGKLSELRDLGRALGSAEGRIDYIAAIEFVAPTSRLPSLLPAQAVVSFVHPGRKVLVAHQGILTRKDGQLWLTHASPDSRKVIRVGFLDYLKRRTRSDSSIGIHILAIAD